ncbi:ABC-type Fe3+-siderophore transport system, permease component [Halalkaliarchaeum sp. AArc-CO]|uniref:vitamin B12 ABC transporter permease BtuC n=1 Tax=Halalkaliarchaeum sp. AArc-CO TaxID=2866381 RepID=UPI0031F2F84A|nr:ABC-type Fe3+-siderophore transport system, permease component [Halalkaliarchaeum sp. AArc-CO]
MVRAVTRWEPAARSAKSRAVAWSTLLAALLAVVVTVAAGIGPVTIPPTEIAKILLNSIPVPAGLELTWGGVVIGGLLQLPGIDLSWRPLTAYPVNSTHERIVMQVRLPRILLAALVGFSLAAAGTVMQGFFRNPMADPSIIGVSSGAALGATVFIVAPLALPFGLGLRGAAFAGALLAAFAVYVIATENGRTPVATLLLAGVAVQTFLGAMISYLQLQAGESLRQVVAWLMGHLQGSTWSEVQATLLVVPILFVVLLAYSRDLNVLLLGEEDAKGLGIEVERTKRILLAASSVITAAGVAVAGVIGFVGLIVPHMLRLVVGPDHRVLLPASALAGAAFLVVADTVARAGATEIPVGIVTAAVGAPFFLYLLRKREVHEL